MLASIATHPIVSVHLRPSKFPPDSPHLKPLKNPIFSTKPKTSYLHLNSLSGPKMNQPISRRKLSASPTEPILSEEEQEEVSPEDSERLAVVVMPIEKPRLALKFIWMRKKIGIGLNQVIPRYGTIPLSPYYFWPREDAWEQLKLLLESKPWISQNQVHILLNQATDIILLWQERNENFY
ncbi:hypothetical protein Tsubulata_046707 [Turnera subulata]|uniref:30S ribosomal protein 3, chloroplastic n=1 Tax=Turnera subulata TaxID=218843 RepID=A0A9Q0JJ28_9ROSI|nr:hypothetical protein Tsubulata_046707 [Turnera subulata]